jgi:hypothetical protein
MTKGEIRYRLRHRQDQFVGLSIAAT